MKDDVSPSGIKHVAATPVEGSAATSVVSQDDFAVAWEEITAWPGYQATPLVSLSNLASELGVARIDYKHEGPRFGLGSFKALGGAYAALRVLQRELSERLGKVVTLPDIRKGTYAQQCAQITLVSATDGNHGRSLAWGCQRVGAPCRIYIHAEVSETRAQVMRDFGADVLRIDGDYDASVALAREEADANGWFVVSDTSWEGYTAPPRDVMAGYGVMTREAIESMDAAPTHVFLQGGVGGLAAAVAAGLRQHYGAASPRVIVVEPDLAPCLYASAVAGEMTSVEISEETIMAGLSCGEPSEIAWRILEQEVSDYLTIPDALVAPTIRMLARGETGDPAIEAGESAVAGLAALMATRKDPDLAAKLGLTAQSRILLIGSEGVTDQQIFDQIMQEAMDD